MLHTRYAALFANKGNILRPQRDNADLELAAVLCAAMGFQKENVLNGDQEEQLTRRRKEEEEAAVRKKKR